MNARGGVALALRKENERLQARIAELERQLGQFATVSADSTESRLSHEKLPESEERFRSLFHASLAGLMVHSQGVILDANLAFARLFGYARPEELVGRNGPELLLAPESAVLVRQMMEERRDGVLEVTGVRKDGSTFEAETESTPISYRGRDARVVTCRDITGRKLAAEALREGERRHRAILQTAMDGFWCMNLEGRFLEVNQAYCRMSGYSEQELLAMRIADLEDLESAADVAAHIGRIMARGEDRFETRHRRKDGSSFPVEVSAQYKPEDSGQIVAFLRDVTERKRSEAALLERNRYIETILENAPIGFAVNTIHDGKGVFVGHKFEEIYGVAPGSTRTVDEYFEKVYLDPEFREQIRTRIMADMASGDPARMRWEDIPITTAEGHRKYITAINIPIFEQNLMVSTVQDVTERKRAEEDRERLKTQLTQAQKMESIGRLAGGVAHDFNNLLTVINGYSRLALNRLSAGDPLRDQIEEIHKAEERAAGLTRQLLAFSRKQVLQPRVLDLNSVVGEMRSMLERLMGEDVEVRFALQTEIAPAHADPHQLEQVIMNLAVNARDAMPGGGRLLIETALVERDDSYAESHPEARAGRYAMLAVSDTGAGMDEATQQRIFEPFFTTKGAGKGTGLGLSMVQGIVAQSGGYINVYSEPGRGTTFKIYLPVLAGATADAARPAIISTLRGRETILVVEDQAEVRNYAVAVLKSYGYNVIEVVKPDEALTICEREGARIHLVLTDVVMPDTSGRELAARLAELRPGIKVLFMSGYTDNVIVHHGVLDEGAHFIEKPFSPEELAGKVRAVLGPPAPAARVLLADDEAGRP